MVWRLPNPATSTSHNGHHSDSLFSMGASLSQRRAFTRWGNPAPPTEVALDDAHVSSWARSSDYDLSCGPPTLPAGGSSVTAKWFSSTFKASGCTTDSSRPGGPCPGEPP